METVALIIFIALILFGLVFFFSGITNKFKIPGFMWDIAKYLVWIEIALIGYIQKKYWVIFASLIAGGIVFFLSKKKD